MTAGPTGLLRVPAAALSVLEMAAARAGLPAVGYFAQIPHYVTGGYAPASVALALQCAPLARLQNELFDLGADLSVPYAGPDERLRVTQQQVDGLEGLCDAFNESLPELKSFVLPGGTKTAARLHVARTVARRAELRALEADAAPGVDPLALVYLNRVSDLLFILARAANADGGEGEPLWRPGRAR